MHSTGFQLVLRYHSVPNLISTHCIRSPESAFGRTSSHGIRTNWNHKIPFHMCKILSHTRSFFGLDYCEMLEWSLKVCKGRRFQSCPVRNSDLLWCLLVPVSRHHSASSRLLLAFSFPARSFSLVLQLGRRRKDLWHPILLVSVCFHRVFRRTPCYPSAGIGPVGLTLEGSTQAAHRFGQAPTYHYPGPTRVLEPGLRIIFRDSIDLLMRLLAYTYQWRA